MKERLQAIKRALTKGKPDEFEKDRLMYETTRHPFIHPTAMEAWGASSSLGGESNSVVPMVIEQTSRGERAYDIYSLLLKNRIVFFGTEVYDSVANLAIAQLLYLSREDPDADVEMYINSPGGSVSDGLAIYDTMQIIQPNVSTTCVGLAASMGAVLLAGGAEGKRKALPNASVMIHSVSSGFRGTAADIAIEAREILRLQQRMKEILVQHTGQPMDKISLDMDRDFWMTAEVAKEYGMVDAVVGKSKD